MTKDGKMQAVTTIAKHALKQVTETISVGRRGRDTEVSFGVWLWDVVLTATDGQVRHVEVKKK